MSALDALTAAYYRLEPSTRRSLYRLRSARSFARLQRERETRFRPFVEQRAIFVHIPKCGGMSVGTALFGSAQLSHRPVKDYQVIFTPEEFSAFYKFTVVRNPWDRLVSGFHYLKGGGGTPGDQAWAARHLASYPDFAAFVRDGLPRGDIQQWQHFRPQHGYVCLPGQRVPLVDRVCRVESLQADIDAVCDDLGRAHIALPKINASKHRDFRDYYDAESRERVGRHYATDIALFGYRFDA